MTYHELLRLVKAYQEDNIVVETVLASLYIINRGKIVNKIRKAAQRSQLEKIKTIP